MVACTSCGVMPVYMDSCTVSAETKVGKHPTLLAASVFTLDVFLVPPALPSAAFDMAGSAAAGQAVLPRCIGQSQIGLFHSGKHHRRGPAGPLRHSASSGVEADVEAPVAVQPPPVPAASAPTTSVAEVSITEAERLVRQVWCSPWWIPHYQTPVLP